MKPTLNRFLTRLSKQGNRVSRKIHMLAIVAMLLLSGMSASNKLSAQSTLGFDSIGLIGMPDTVAPSDQWLVGVFLRNFSPIDSLTPADSVQVRGFVDSLSGPTTVYATPWAHITLAPNDTQFFILPINFDSISGFRVGNNVIVVWPITSNQNFDPQDSLVVNVLVIIDVSTGSEPEVGEIRCYPVPASGPLYITSSNRALVVKEITIRDATGKIVAISNNPSTGILTDDWATGIYLLEIMFENGKRSTHKIIK
jgi:hypothetical protein